MVAKRSSIVVNRASMATKRSSMVPKAPIDDIEATVRAFLEGLEAPVDVLERRPDLLDALLEDFFHLCFRPRSRRSSMAAMASAGVEADLANLNGARDLQLGQADRDPGRRRRCGRVCRQIPGDRGVRSIPYREAEGEPCACWPSFPCVCLQKQAGDDGSRQRRLGLELTRGSRQSLHRPLNVDRSCRMAKFSTPTGSGGAGCITSSEASLSL